MGPQFRVILLLLAPLAPAACGTGATSDANVAARTSAAHGETDTYWRKAGAGESEFALDNQSCGAAATRVTPTARADQLAGGAFAPRNRIDRPPRRWIHPVAENAYMGCMAERGWHLVQR